jgi:quercetin dioxygenase-like cupin family protein
MKPEIKRIEDFPSQTVGGHEGFAAQRLLKLSSEDVTVRLINVVPGGKGPVPAHQHADTHFFWVLEGKLELEISGTIHPIPSGCCIEVPPNIVHQLRCGDESPMRVLAIKWI